MADSLAMRKCMFQFIALKRKALIITGSARLAGLKVILQLSCRVGFMVQRGQH